MTQNSETALVLKRTIAAPREKVFRAWTEPEMLEKWFHASSDWTTPICEVELKEGGRYRLGMQPPAGETPYGEGPYVAYGTYHEIKKPEKLVFTWSWEGQDPTETLVTVSFNEVGGKTQIELIHERFPDKEEKDEHNKGWNECLDQLAKLF